MRRPPVTLLFGVTTLLLTVGAVTVVTAGTGAVTASPESERFCPICPGSDDGTIHPNDIETTTVDIHVHEDGRAEWTSVTEITNASVADAWREGPPEFSALGREGPVTEPYDEPTVTVTDEDELVVRFTDHEALRSPSGGALVVTYFHRLGANVPSYIVTADRITVHAPDGYDIANEPAGATRHGDQATWNGTLGDDTLVVFAPADARASGVRASIAEGVVLAPLVGTTLLRVLSLAGLFGIFFGTFAWTVRKLRTYDPSPTVVGGSVALGLVALFLSLRGLAALREDLLRESLGAGILLGLLVALPLLGIALVRLNSRNAAGATLGVLSLVVLLLASQVEFTGEFIGTPWLTLFIVVLYLGILAIPLVLIGAVLDRGRAKR